MDTITYNGRVIFFLPEKGYGFVRLIGTAEEFHFRERDVAFEGVKGGDFVQFQLKGRGKVQILKRVDVA